MHLSTQCVQGLMFLVESNIHRAKFSMWHWVRNQLLGSALNHGKKLMYACKHRDWGWAEGKEEKEGSICISGRIKGYQWEAGCTSYLAVGRVGNVLWWQHIIKRSSRNPLWFNSWFNQTSWNCLQYHPGPDLSEEFSSLVAKPFCKTSCHLLSQ